MKYNYFCFFIFIGLIFSAECNTAGQGKIIFVNGSCSSGKSSIVKILAQKLNAKTFAFDELVMPIVLKKFITKHYGKFLAFFINGFVMRNFFSSIDFLSEKTKYKFQIKFCNDLRAGLAVEPTKKMYRDAKNAADLGGNVVIESPLFLWDGVDFLNCLSEFEGANISYVLAYCPWNDVVERLKKRNSSPNKKVHRELDWVVGNYMNCFDISPDYRGKNYLEYIESSNVRKVVAEYAQPQYKKKQLHLMAETQNIALQKFPQDIGYYIYPRFKYNLTVNTKINTSEQGAALILDSI